VAKELEIGFCLPDDFYVVENAEVVLCIRYSLIYSS